MLQRSSRDGQVPVQRSLFITIQTPAQYLKYCDLFALPSGDLQNGYGPELYDKVIFPRLTGSIKSVRHIERFFNSKVSMNAIVEYSISV
jgi:hypothetical protein